MPYDGPFVLSQVLAVVHRQQFHRPEKLRRVGFRDPETGKVLVFLANNFDLPALTIARLYKLRWRVELFFKWIKGHLRIKSFLGTSRNAVLTQVWSALCTYLMVAILKKQLALLGRLGHAAGGIGDASRATPTTARAA